MLSFNAVNLVCFCVSKDLLKKINFFCFKLIYFDDFKSF